MGISVLKIKQEVTKVVLRQKWPKISHSSQDKSVAII